MSYLCLNTAFGKYVASRQAQPLLKNSD